MASVKVLCELVASVQELCVAANQPVEAGATLVLLESMKMEIPVLAEQAGRVSEFKVSAGDVVQEGDVLLVLET